MENRYVRWQECFCFNYDGTGDSDSGGSVERCFVPGGCNLKKLAFRVIDCSVLNVLRFEGAQVKWKFQ